MMNTRHVLYSLTHKPVCDENISVKSTATSHLACGSHIWNGSGEKGEEKLRSKAKYLN